MAFNIAKFKNTYKNDFQFVDDYNLSLSYVAGDIVFLLNTEEEVYNKEANKVYITEAAVAIGVEPPSNPWLVYVGRKVIPDFFIERSLEQAMQIYNGGRFSGNGAEEGLWLLVAHFITIDARMGGLNSTGGAFVSSTSVAGVAISYDIPDRVKHNPTYAHLSKTSYGTKYISLIYANSITSRIKISGKKQNYGFFLPHPPFITRS